jgi:VWFA-related protein
MKRSNKVMYFFWVLMLAFIPAVLTGCGGGDESSPTVGNTDPAVSLSATQLDFSGVVIGSFSDRTITVENSGNSELTVGQITPPMVPFDVLEDDCSGRELLPADTCGVKIRFSPTEQKTYADDLAIPSDAGVDTPVVTLRGTGNGLGVSINRIDTQSCSANGKMSLLVSVADQYGDAVLGLQSTHFKIFENGQAIPSVDLVSTSGPISVGLAMDYSSSTVPYTASLETAAEEFIDLLAPEDEAELIKFSEQYEVAQEFTTDKPALLAAVEAPLTIERTYTHLNDMLLVAIDNTAARSNDRLAVVVFSDGNDFGSQTSLDEVIAHANKKGIPVFTVALGEISAEQMQRLSSETGGQYFLAADTSSLQSVYAQISQILSNQYQIEYTSTSCDAEKVHVRVEVEDDNGNKGTDSRDFVIGTN